MKRRLFVWFSAVSAAVLFLPQLAGAALTKASVLEKNVGYLRIAKMDKGLAGSVQSALNDFQSTTNPIAGIVLDLRFTGGNATDDLAAIERLLEQPKLPLAILINAQTAGASARLAEDLREENTGLVFGSAADNFQPDISIPANTDDQKKFLNDPYAVLPYNTAGPDTSTNLLVFVDIDHTTEADLVREKIKDGEQESLGPDPATQASAIQNPFIHDPVLARGVDFIKGVAALHLTANQP